MVEEKIAELYPEKQMRCPVHLCIGQEAIAVGVCANLSKKDYVLSNHRSHGHFLAKGGSLKAMFAEIYGKVTGCAQGKGGSMHLIDLSVGFLGSAPIVASTIPVAVGSALGTKQKNKNNVTVVFFGDAAIEEGVFNESINFAVLKELPIIFVCENNLYGVYSPFSVRQPKNREIFLLAKAFGIESYHADGNDVTQVYNLTKQAVKKIRSGGGPVFFEFETYRWREHCGPNYDNNIGYRSEQEFFKWEKRCPIKRLQQHLLNECFINEKGISKIFQKIKLEIEEAVDFAKTSSYPNEKAAGDHVYTD
jgi:pyruvate dehydrogenase E1 component alpha subunit